MTSEQSLPSAHWFVGSTHDSEDFTDEFVNEGYWRNFGADRNVSLTKSMRPGERIAIKSAFVRKNGLPFEGNGNFASVMLVKAVGTIESNPGDGQSVTVVWDKNFQPKEWYFYTNRQTIWKVSPNDSFSKDLISFAFEGSDQDIELYLNNWFWKDRFGEGADTNSNFAWTKFYQSVADALLSYKQDRTDLVAEVHKILEASGMDGYLTDRYPDGTRSPLMDICPFTALGIFNRQTTDAVRVTIAEALGKFLGVQETTPTSFDGIPVLNNQNSWFFGFSDDREDGDIDRLWNVFESAINTVAGDDYGLESQFAEDYDIATNVRWVGWNLTMGLYWIRPWDYPTLEGASRTFIKNKLGISLPAGGQGGRATARGYTELKGILESNFKDDQYPVHSFPELSLAAWHFVEPDVDVPTDVSEESDDLPESATPIPLIRPYSLGDVVSDGCFLDTTELKDLLDRLRSKKNVILQGPPGTGKTWLARRLAFALIGEKSDRKVKVVQFHPNLSYEDFVRGWRPQGDGKLELQDGPFLEMVEMAKADPDPESKYAVVIEEINRGNPAQIFGELLTLLESDKRNPNESMELSYRKHRDERVHIPSNLYVIGTMNVADRSLALVDLALRRRFAFVDLEPRLGNKWQSWVSSNSNIPDEFLDSIKSRLVALNNEITADPTLGKQFCIGHSFVTPRQDEQISDPAHWYEMVVRTEIGPQLDEYWFDAPEKSRSACSKLLEGLV